MARTRPRPRLRRILLFILALLFLFESWLWDVTGRALLTLASYIPIEHWKERFRRRIEHFSPWLTLTVFAIPALMLLPLKFLALWLLAKGYVLGGISTILFAKVAGFAVSSFLFLLCKPKLMELRFVRWIYETLINLRDRAHRFVEPYLHIVRASMKRIRRLVPRGKLLAKIRAQMHKARQRFKRGT